MGCEAALKQVTSAVSGTPRRSVLLPVPDSSRASSLPRPPARIKSGRVSIWPTAGLLPGGRASLLAMGCAAALKPATSVVSDEPSQPVLLPVPGSSRASSLPRPPARIKSGRVSIWPTTGLLPGGRASLLAMGCAAALKPATSVVSDEPSQPVLLPVPGSSRASLLLRPPARIKGGRCLSGPQRGFCPEGVGTGRRFACPRKGLCILRNAPSETPSSRTSPTQKRSVARSAPTLIDRGRATR
ncbi:hypothetical protein BKM03_13795 [Pseudomonas avellanae]|uniref:Uncharacterized protein n=1 Tax=Pseudomonas avellanae TaxID=46257 RepID=A0AAD0DX08_9PSED|nr:hypothetical protein BKM03_13795 [Pseudomonas avellanae]